MNAIVRFGLMNHVEYILCNKKIILIIFIETDRLLSANVKLDY